MKRIFSYRFLPLLTAGLGAVGLLLRLALYALQEPSGLLPSQHPLHTAAVILSVLTAALVLALVTRLGGSGKYQLNFPASPLAALGAFFAGLWLLPVPFEILRHADSNLTIARAVLGFLSIPCLLFTGWCHWKGRRPHFLLHGAACLFFALHMVCQYQLWSGNPQLEDYLLPLFACVFLTLTAYYRMAFDARMGNRRALLFCGLMAGFFCICSLAGEGENRFYFAGGLWALTNLCVIEPPLPSRKTEEGTDASA